MKRKEGVLARLKPVFLALQRFRALLLTLSVIVVFITVYLLILPAFTLEKDTVKEQGGISLTNDPADGELSYSGDGYEVKASYAQKAGLPEDTKLNVDEITDQSDQYQDYYKKALKAVDASDFSFAKFYDISLKDGEEEVEPADPVNVTISYDKSVSAKDADHVKIIHFVEDEKTGKITPEVLKDKKTDITVKKEKMQEASFEADSFSVYGVVYTVDFSWGLDGQQYDFTLTGGASVSLRELAAALHFAGKDDQDIESFLAQVESVTFSDESLVKPVKISDTITAKELKKQLGLKSKYSSELTEDEIAALEAKEFTAPDWALLALKPFKTEETLTVVMRDGEEFKITVTDDQSDAPYKPDGTVQTIENPNGTTIDLFDYWIDSSLENDTNYGRSDWPNSGSWFYYNVNTHQYVNNNTGLNLYGKGNDSGINAGHAFKFTPAQAGSVIDGTLNTKSIDASDKNNPNGGVNSWTHGATPRVGIVEKNLDSNGYPVLTNNSSIGTDGQNLDYLFDDSNQDGKARYAGVNNLLYVDPDGYYTYDSHDFNADYNKSDKTFTVKKQTADVGEARGFWPFGNQSFWLGMHMHTDFSMPANGQVLNPKGVYKDMTFEFQGDDDTWLYVDGILVGDGGGIHNQTLIRINFKDGTVLVSGEYDAKNDYKTNYHNERYLDDVIREGLQAQGKTEAEINVYMSANFEGHTFKQGSEHTFDMFYLERGGGESNLRIHYNLISTTDFSAHKSYHMLQNDPHARLERNQFKFELIGYDNTDLDTGFEQAIMPVNGTPTGEGTYESPKKKYYEATADEQGYTSLIIGVTEDGNVNFGNVQVQASQAGMTYRYMVREVVDPDAENADGIKWKNATEDQRAEGGFIDVNGVTYDGRVYYFTGTVQETSPGSGKYELKKTRYTDETYTEVDTKTKFFSFVNGHVEPITLKVLKKSDSDSHKPLSGAQFSLVRAKHTVQTDDQGHVTSDKWIPRSESTPKTGTTSSGQLTFNNLAEGHYILEETAPPSGYAKKETYRWLLTMTKEDSEDEIVLVPTIRPLDEDGHVTGEAVTLDVDNQHTMQYEVLNTKLPKGPLTAEKKWIKPDGTTEYTADELTALGEDIQNTQITGELWRRAMAETAAPTVSIYSKLNNENEYQLRWQEQVEPGSNVAFSMAVNGTGYPINEQYTTDTGDPLTKEDDRDIYYDYISGSQIHKQKGHVFALKSINHDVSIYGEFDSSKASNSNNPRIGFKLISYTQPTGSGPQQIDEKAADFTLDSSHNWTVTWERDQLNEDDYDYEYYLKNVTENSAPEGFNFFGDPDISTDITTGAMTFTVKNIKEGPVTDLTVRKVWGDNLDHSQDTISYKIQRAEYNAEGGAASEPYDYIETGKTAADIYSLSASDEYDGAAWTKHHDRLPATNGKEETDPDYRVYKYSVVEVNQPSEYTASYLTVTEQNDGDPYDVQIIKNNPKDDRVSVEKKWMDHGKTSEISIGIPDGSYITGTLKKTYTWQEASGASVRVYNRLWANGQILSTTLYKTYTVQDGTDLSLWAIDSNGNEPLNGVQANGSAVSQSGAEHTYNMGGWYKSTRAYVVRVNGATEIILDWAYNTGFQNGWHYNVDYTEAAGGGQTHTETETVGTFRIDASNDWKWVWTDRELDQDHVYTYFFEDVQEHQADGTVVTHFDGFKPPEVGNLTQGADGKWTCTIINEQELLETGITFKKVDVADLNKENLTSDDLLKGAKFKLEKYLSLQPDEKDTAWNAEHSTESSGDGNGTFEFENLPVGYYKIIETEYPAGYNKMESDPIILIRKIEGQNRLEVVQVDQSGNPLDDTSSEIIRILPNQTNEPTSIVVGNTPGSSLPYTGGAGTKVFMLFGLILVAGAGFLLRVKKRLT